MRAAAFFDLDKTLIAHSTVLAFARPLYQARLLRRRDITRSAYAQLNFVSDKADHALMERMRTQLSATIAGWEVDALRSVITEHVGSVLEPLVYAEGTELIAAHRDAGRPVILVTSTGADLAEPVGRLLGVDEVLSTRMIEGDGRYTGEIADYMYGARKAEAIRELARDRGLDLSASFAYSDSLTDLPMLEAVGHPHAVNPDRALRQIALDRGWPVLDFHRAAVLHRTSRQQFPIMIMIVAASIAIAVGLGRLYARRRR